LTLPRKTGKNELGGKKPWMLPKNQSVLQMKLGSG
jgi:hypothetical protein